MHHLTCGINSLFHSVNLIVFTVLLVHLILVISPHHSHHPRSHHLSLPRPFTPDLKLISFTNPLHHSHSYRIVSYRSAGTGATYKKDRHRLSCHVLDHVTPLSYCQRRPCLVSHIESSSHQLSLLFSRRVWCLTLLTTDQSRSRVLLVASWRK